MTTLSAEAIGNNIDLLKQILLRVPVKPVVRFKCVSKQWLSLISDPQFYLSYNRYHHSPYPTPTALLVKKSYLYPTPIALFVNKNIPIRDGVVFNTDTLEFNIIPLKHDTTICISPSLDFLNIPLIKILQFCNGLLLCFSYEISGSVFPGQFQQPVHLDSYFICNPITKQFKKLPFPDRKFADSAFNLCLAFDPLKSIHYKITAFLKVPNQRQLIGPKKCQIYIYSSETDSWSPTEIIFAFPMTMRLQTVVFCNGALHWCTLDGNCLYFDVDRECLNTMPRLDDKYCRVLQYFGESRGHLHLIVKESGLKLEFDVLEMATDYSGWFVRYHVNLDALRIVFPTLFWPAGKGYSNVCSVLCVIRAEKEEESIIVVSLNGKAISCNVSDGTSVELFDLESKTEVCYTGFVGDIYKVYQFFETLSCV